MQAEDQEIPKNAEAGEGTSIVGTQGQPVDPLLLRVARLYLAARALTQDCRLRNHHGEKRLGDGAANMCIRCLKHSKLALDKIGEALDGHDADATEKALVARGT